jgi:hypothetical protein
VTQAFITGRFDFIGLAPSFFFMGRGKRRLPVLKNTGHEDLSTLSEVNSLLLPSEPYMSDRMHGRETKISDKG